MDRILHVPGSQTRPFFRGRAGLQQRVLPSYRAGFVEALAKVCLRGLGVFAGQPRPEESIHTAHDLSNAKYVPAGNLHLFSVNSPLYFCWQTGLLRWLEKWQPDVLIVEANPRYPTTRSAIRWMHARSRPVIGWGLGAPALAGPLNFLRQRERLGFLHSLDALIAYSSRGANEYVALGLPANRVFFAPNATCLPPAGGPLARPPAYHGKPCLLFVGRLQARKRIDDLLSACVSLPADLQPRLVIVGDGPARADFQALAAQVYPQAEFPGARQGAELEPYFTAADLFVLPGTGGLAIQEAMAHALPVMVAAGDGTQDDLVTPGNGWLIQPGNPAALASTLRIALSDVQRLRQMGAESYRIVAEEANINVMTDVFVQALNSVCK